MNTEQLIAAFKNPRDAKKLVKRIHDMVPQNADFKFMEVCGTHTMSIHRFGIKSLLPPQVKLISGPGCPVCVTPTPYLDAALALLDDPSVIITTFGDMLRVPGATGTLEERRGTTGRVNIVYSPIEAVTLSEANPNKQVVFLAVGFETTIPTIAAALGVAIKKGLKNFSLLVGHKTVPMALEALLGMEHLDLTGFLLPGHVSVIIGADDYKPVIEKHNIASAITGFEPVDMLMGISMLVQQAIEGKARLDNVYPRVVHPQGNIHALKLIDTYFEPCDAIWRGIGPIPGSGLKLKKEFEAYDAASRFGVDTDLPEPPTPCRCGDVLCGAIAPPECPLFGKACTPQKPIGACMVSSEGSCAAYYKYSR